MADEYRIVGPPGAGKTTTIRSRVERWVKDDEYAAEDIVLTSFSRAAAAELAGGVPVPRENVATLHSLARRALGQQPIAEVGALAKQWDESGVPPAWRIGGQATADIDDGLAPLEGGGMLSTYALYRSKMLPAEHPLYELQAMLDVADTLGAVNKAQASYKGPDSDQLLWSMVDNLAEARRERIRSTRGK